jgi:hypothetical protein
MGRGRDFCVKSDRSSPLHQSSRTFVIRAIGRRWKVIKSSIPRDLVIVGERGKCGNLSRICSYQVRDTVTLAAALDCLQKAEGPENETRQVLDVAARGRKGGEWVSKSGHCNRNSEEFDKN